MLYLGSCRYMYNFKWSYFPARIHTTREIIFFLENIETLETVIKENPSDLINCIFGDIYHPSVKNDSLKFITHNRCIFEQYKNFILEICSRKVYYFNNIPLNYYYTERTPAIIEKYKLKKKILTNDEIKTDLKRIVGLLKNKFHPHATIHIIPHLNLKLRSTQQYIQSRNELVNVLRELCIKLNLNFYNIATFIERTVSAHSFLEDYMADGTHYSRGYNLVKGFLIKNIL